MVSISHNRPLRQAQDRSLRQIEEDYREHEDSQLIDSPLSVLHVNGALSIRPKHSNPTSPEADRLTDREMEVLSLVAEGFSNKAIASRLLIRERTVKNHLTGIMTKLRASDRTHAVVTAIRLGWLAI